MQQNVIHKLIQQANKLPVLEYNPNLIILKDNVDVIIREVKQRIGVLQTLKAEIDYQLTLTHTDDEEFT